MDIHLNDSDISQMPEQLRTGFLDWLPKRLNAKPSQPNRAPMRPHSSEPETQPIQLSLDLEPANQTSEEKVDNSHVRLSQLLDAGITKRGMPVRVKLKQEIAKKLGRDYINSLEISPKGTIVFDGQEFDKPSPLAQKVNGSSGNGWVYIEVKKNNEWVCLDELRENWRKTND
ncbi:restriction system modified-DNA reader domain-containing protein [Phormidium nigroviride]